MSGFRSILFPTPESAVVDDDFVAPDSLVDLHLDQIVAAMFTEVQDLHLDEFFRMPLRTADAVYYRHEVFADFARDEVRAPFDAFAHGMRTVREHHEKSVNLFHPKQRERWRVDAVDAYCRTIVTLHQQLANTDIRSRGLLGFEQHIAEYVAGSDFQRLLEATQRVRDELATIRYTVQMNDDEVRVDRFESQPDFAAEVESVFARFVGAKEPDAFGEKVGWPGMNSVEERILDAVGSLFPRAFKMLEKYCQHTESYVDPTIVSFEREVQFYLSYLAFTRRMGEVGINFCYPQVADSASDVAVQGAVDLALALRMITDGTVKSLVRNDAELAYPERILVVTGPNQSGKTAYARMIGQICYLAAFGCPVPARQAWVPVVDRLFTNFERKEHLATLHGRLDEELMRVHDVLVRATDRSLIVMNESFASTTGHDAVAIGAEVIERIAKCHAVAVYVTYLDELAKLSPATVSVVGELDVFDPTRRTFRFRRRAADGLTHSEVLAGRYGLTYEAMMKRIAGQEQS